MQRATRDAILIAIVALIANFAYLHFSNGDFFFPDSFTYLAPARNLRHGLGFVTEPGVAETMRTPGYPLFLLPFTNMTALVAVQHLLNVGLAVAIYFFTRRRLSRFAAVIAALIFALDVPTIHYANKVLSETLFTVLLFGLFVLAARGRASGLLSGALVLIRPVAILYFAVLLRRRRIIAFSIAALALPLLWAARNGYRTGVFTVSSIAGVNWLEYRAAGALAMEDQGEDFQADLRTHQKELEDEAEDEIDDRLHVAAEDLPHAVMAREYGRIGRRVALQHPAALAALTARGILIDLLDSDWEALEVVSPLHPSLLELAFNALQAALLVLAAIGILMLWRSDRELALLLLLTIVYFVVMTAGAESEARFRVPVIPQLAIAAAAGVDALRRLAAAPAPR
ncbi:MAG TPA: hypothetical protein VGR02_14240 [Thermoanaerobaculia bacterium]|jgi:hypothetical protein|nr:hypothetical protein [Thermoanaerobaculia bacterium]